MYIQVATTTHITSHNYSHAAMNAFTKSIKSIASDASTCTAPSRPSYVAEIDEARPAPSCSMCTLRYTHLDIFMRSSFSSLHDMRSLFLPRECGEKRTARAQLGSAMMASPSTRSALLAPEAADASDDLEAMRRLFFCDLQPLQRRDGGNQLHRSGAVQWYTFHCGSRCRRAFLPAADSVCSSPRARVRVRVNTGIELRPTKY
jgi:hypothetical protein